MTVVIINQQRKPIMNIKDSVVFITGANRGLGLQLAKAALAAGAKRVYGAARDPKSVTLPGVIPVQLDVTRHDDIAAVTREFRDVTILINNAGIVRTGGILADNALEQARAEMETNVIGPMLLSKGFAPTLQANGGGAIVNILSVLAWYSQGPTNTYSMSKSAAWALTNGLRIELAAQGTLVLGAHMGYMETDMTAGYDMPKVKPEDVAAKIFEALAAGKEEVLADELTHQVKLGINADVPAYIAAAHAAA
jgi:NAD(P)-dependent dehydrogenase (short-subunit alcohol dehydrogenase family)